MRRNLTFIVIGVLLAYSAASAQDTITRSWKINFSSRVSPNLNFDLGDSIYVYVTDSIRVYSTNTSQKLWSVPKERGMFGIVISREQGLEGIAIASAYEDTTTMPIENRLNVALYRDGMKTRQSSILISTRQLATDRFSMVLFQVSPSGRYYFVSDGRRSYIADVEQAKAKYVENVDVRYMYYSMIDDRVTFNSDESKMAITKKWDVRTSKGSYYETQQHSIIQSTDVFSSEQPDSTYYYVSEPVVYSPIGRRLVVGRYVLSERTRDTLSVLHLPPMGMVLRDGLSTVCAVESKSVYHGMVRDFAVMQYGTDTMRFFLRIDEAERRKFSLQCGTSNGTIGVLFGDSSLSLYRVQQNYDTCLPIRLLGPDSLREHTPFELSYSFLPIDRDVQVEATVYGRPLARQDLLSIDSGQIIADVSLIENDSVVINLKDTFMISSYSSSPRSIWRGSIGYVSDAQLSPNSSRLAVVGSRRCIFNLSEPGVSFLYASEHEKDNPFKGRGWGGVRTGWIDNDQFVFVSAYGYESYVNWGGSYSYLKYTSGVTYMWYNSTTDSISYRLDEIVGTDVTPGVFRTWVEILIPQHQRAKRFTFGYNLGVSEVGAKGNTHQITLASDRADNATPCYGSRTFDIHPHSGEKFFAGRMTNDSTDLHVGSWLTSGEQLDCERTFTLTGISSRYICDGAFILLDSLVISTRTWTVYNKVVVPDDGISIPRTRLYLAFINETGRGSRDSSRLFFYDFPSGVVVGQFSVPARIVRMSTDTLGTLLVLARYDSIVEIIALDSLLTDLGLDNMSVGVKGSKAQEHVVASKMGVVSPNPSVSVVSFGLSGSEPQRITISNSLGVAVRELLPALGAEQVSWNLLTSSGQRVAPGMYGFILRTQDGRILESGTFIVAPE